MSKFVNASGSTEMSTKVKTGIRKDSTLPLQHYSSDAIKKQKMSDIGKKISKNQKKDTKSTKDKPNMLGVVSKSNSSRPSTPSSSTVVQDDHEFDDSSRILRSQVNKGVNKYSLEYVKCASICKEKKYIHFALPVRKHGTGKISILCYVSDHTDMGKALYQGTEVIYRDINYCSKESLVTEQKFGQFKKKRTEKEISNINAMIGIATKDLIPKHSNLTMIRFSEVKSKGFKMKDEACVVLYTRAKSYVPCGEDLFPKVVNAPDGSIFKTDVREGYFILCPNERMPFSEPANKWQKELAIGQSIGPARNLAIGTLGPFVTIKRNDGNSYDAFLTAAHLCFDSPDEIKLAIGTDMNQPAEEDLSRQRRQCGVVKQCFFDDQCDVGVDAALVEIDKERNPTRALFTEVTNNQLLRAEFTETRFPTFDDGSVLDVFKMRAKQMADGKAVKFGQTTGLTVGELLPFTTTAVVDPLALPSCPNVRSYIMKGQLQIHSSTENIFFQAGDSGAAIFFKDKDDNNLHFIGMAIGITSDGICLVTPANAVLTKLSELENAQVEIKAFS